MITNLEGQIIEIGIDNIVVNISGVGFQIFVPMYLPSKVQMGSRIQLFTYLSVREDNLSLYGFQTKEEREFFLLLLGVNGIGPKLALAGISTLNPETIRRAVFSEQPDIFSRIPGIGKKTAQRILLHLSGKVTPVDGIGPISSFQDQDTEVLEALIGLGYSVVEAQTALQTIPPDAPQDIETRIRLALQYFSS